MTGNDMTFMLIWGGSYFVMSLIFGGIGLFIKKHALRNEERCSEETIGEVIDNIKERERFGDDGYTTMYYPVISYEANGQMISKRYHVGANPPSYKLGEHVSVKYDSKSPEKIIVGEDKLLKKIGLIFRISAVVIFMVGVLGVAATVLIKTA